MKSITLYISLLFLVSSDYLYSQDCMQNGTFNFACSGTVFVDNCPTWTNACGDGWVRSHGTPQMIYYSDTSGGKPRTGFYALMWSTAASNGEGMFTSYSFQARRTYDVRLYFATTNFNGIVYVYAANGVTTTGNSCGSPTPTIPSSQLIGQYTGFTNGWLELTFVYTPNADYSQFFIFPVGTGGVQYDLTVANVQICRSCDGQIVYNSGVVPTGESSAGTILVGSSAGTGGSGTVTVNSTANTSLTAVHLIDFKPGFEALVTSGTFSAQTYGCGGLPARKKFEPLHIPIVPSTDNIQSTASPLHTKTEPLPANKFVGALDIYPSISNGIFNIAGDIKALENVELAVFDQLGRHLLKIPKRSYNNNAAFNLSNLNNGIYILQIRQGGESFTKKIVIQK